MTLDEALKMADQFNDTIFANTPEMVEAIYVLTQYIENTKRCPLPDKGTRKEITGKRLIEFPFISKTIFYTPKKSVKIKITIEETKEGDGE